MYRDPAEMLEAELERRGLRQKQFAEMIGVSSQAVSHVIRGKSGLSYREWGRWFGALRLKIMWSTEPLGASMGFFTHREDAWEWLTKQLARRGEPAPSRTAGEFYDVLERAGLLGRWPELLPKHLGAVMQSGWLWHEGNDSAGSLAAQVKEALDA